MSILSTQRDGFPIFEATEQYPSFYRKHVSAGESFLSEIYLFTNHLKFRYLAIPGVMGGMLEIDDGFAFHRQHASILLEEFMVS